MMKACSKKIFSLPTEIFSLPTEIFRLPSALLLCLLISSAASFPVSKQRPLLMRFNPAKHTSLLERKLSIAAKEEGDERDNQRAILEFYHATTDQRTSSSFSYSGTATVSFSFHPIPPRSQDFSFSFPPIPGEDFSFSFPPNGEDSFASSMSFDYKTRASDGGSDANEDDPGSLGGASEDNGSIAAKGEAPALETEQQSTGGKTGMSFPGKAMMIAFLGVATAISVGLYVKEEAKRRMQSAGSAASGSSFSNNTYSVV